MTKSEPQSLLVQIKQANKRLIELDAERAATERHIAALRAELDALPQSERQRAVAQPCRSPEQKIALFRSLFIGRSDVFAKGWHNAKTGKNGYAPACANEWVRGVCDKPQVKCGECPNQAFIPITDRVILDYLQGRCVVGIYPLSADETCHFLAVDFDKGSWQDDVAAFAATCRQFDLPVATERSQSGNGAHAWFFFSEAVPASAARTMGCHLLTETMGNRHELPMTSYDRLFPNQDTMPQGGFGNLIALPLQRRARDAANTVFVDEQFEPYSDQWGHLAAMPRIKPDRVAELARRASDRGQVIGVGSADNEAPDVPWLRPPLEPRSTHGIDSPLPTQVNVVFSQQLYIEKHGLPSALVNEIKRLAAFGNPEFYKKQAMRLSTALTPRVISCAEDWPEHIALPRGCLGAIEELLGAHGITVTIEDCRSDATPLDVTFHGTLTDLQTQAVERLDPHDTGVLVAPPGSGKTVVGFRLIAQRARSTLILLHRTQLLDQWRAQLALFLGLNARDIGQIGGGKRKPNGRLDVAMMQSVVRGDDVDDAVADYDHVIVDECHHVPAVSFERIMRAVRARYVTGLTATPKRRDGHHPILRFQLGPVRFTVDARKQAAGRRFEHQLIVRDTSFYLAGEEQTPGIQTIYGQLADDTTRNELILDDVIQALADGRSPILLTERRAHLNYFATHLRGFARHLVVLQGGMGAKQRRDLIDRLKSIPDEEERLLLATGRFIGEGFDDARLDTLFLVLPVSWKGTLIQYAGRLHRSHRSKDEVRIYDYVDRDVLMLARMFERRQKEYRAMGYTVTTVSETLRPAVADTIIEYDESSNSE